jgi:hypothetical protein
MTASLIVFTLGLLTGVFGSYVAARWALPIDGQYGRTGYHGIPLPQDTDR